MSVICERCKKEIDGIVYTPEFNYTEPHCIDCREQIGDEYKIWQDFYLSEYERLMDSENYLEHGDRLYKQRRDGI